MESGGKLGPFHFSQNHANLRLNLELTTRATSDPLTARWAALWSGVAVDVVGWLGGRRPAADWAGCCRELDPSIGRTILTNF